MDDELGLSVIIFIIFVAVAWASGYVMYRSHDADRRIRASAEMEGLLYQKVGDTRWFLKSVDSSGKVYIPGETK